MKRLTDPEPRPGARKARASLILAASILAAATFLAAGLAVDAAPAGTATPAGTGARSGLAPFVGTWRAEFALNPGDQPLPWIEMTIRNDAGRPVVGLTVFRNRRQDDGSVKTDRIQTEVADLRVTGKALRFRSIGEFEYKDGRPKETVEFDQVFELGEAGEATLRQTWSSLEGRKDVPPPPPGPIVLRRVPVG